MKKISIDNFLQNVNSLEEEFKNKLLKEKQLSSGEKILLENNIIPLKVGDKDSSFLGQGGSARAYECIYNGKHCVAKITSISSDVEAIVNLHKLKQKLGPLAKHILNFYKLIKHEDFYIVIVEYLKPTNIHIENLFDNLDGSSGFDDDKDISKVQLQQRLKSLLNKKVINNIVMENVFKILGNLDLSIKMKIVELISVNIFDKLTNIVKKENINQEISNLFRSLDKEVLDILNKNKISKHFGIKSNNLISNLHRIFNTYLSRSFPTDIEDFKERSSLVYLPEVRSLIKCLSKLEQLGVSFKDLHNENIMERSDGTLVLSDPGWFDFS